MASLCRRFGISRQWGYELVRRFKAEDIQGLLPRSRAPKHRKRALAAEVKEAIIALRCQHQTWGPKKLRARLARQVPEIIWPAQVDAPQIVGRRHRRKRLGDRKGTATTTGGSHKPFSVQHIADRRGVQPGTSLTL
ncbi:MAG: helix-turn-helix domain-containing protein [Hyphomicrobiales bacterium]|nr:helix-turn-helix domain-containing protein [Hyphomicrobiales bacterium]